MDEKQVSSAQRYRSWYSPDLSDVFRILKIGTKMFLFVTVTANSDDLIAKLSVQFQNID